jgi:hypothetical protein
MSVSGVVITRLVLPALYHFYLNGDINGPYYAMPWFSLEGSSDMIRLFFTLKSKCVPGDTWPTNN